MLGCHPSTLTQRSMHHQKSSSDSPFKAKTGNPGTEREMVLNPVRWALRRPGSPHHCALACNLIVCQHLPSRRSFRDTLKTHTQGSREDSALPFLISSSPPRKSSVHHMRGQHHLKSNIYLQNQAFAASQMTCLPVRHVIHKLNQMYFDS